MARISPRTHGIADYATATMLLAAPGLLGARDTRARALLRGVGVTVLGQALVTDWDVAPLRKLPLRAHLAADAATGTTLLAAPWLPGLRGRGAGAWFAPVLVGAVEAALAALTDQSPAGASAAAAETAGRGPSTTPAPGGGPHAVAGSSVPGAPSAQPDRGPGTVTTPAGDAPDADRVAGLEPVAAPAPLDAPGPSVTAPATTEGSTTEREELVDAMVPDSESLGVAGADPIDQLVAREEAAAAAEASLIGGEPSNRAGGDADVDPAGQPVYEAGGGDQEGFEMAEDELVRNATHDIGGGNPLRDAFTPEAESDRSTAEYGEPDDEPAVDRAAREDD